MNKVKILVAEDEARMRKLVKDFLTKAGYEVLEAGDGMEAIDCYFENDDLKMVITDVMMPRMDGWQLCREIRNDSPAIPIVMLTARGEEHDELRGYELGVDEYITKPFSPKVLVARVEAILRRSSAQGADGRLEKGGIVIDRTAHMVTIEGKSVDLSYKEFELLTYLVENEGIALSREKILKAVWDYDYLGEDRTIDTHIKKLRSKMGEQGNLIQTIRGIGYKFSVEE